MGRQVVGTLRMKMAHFSRESIAKISRVEK
jgi:hypothetical protein